MAIVREIRCEVTGEKYSGQRDWFLVRLTRKYACIERYDGQPLLKNWVVTSTIGLAFSIQMAWARELPLAKKRK